MAADNLRFYLDENLPVEIARQLQARGIDVVTVRDLEKLGDEDVNHLKRATEMQRVLCTYDADYLRLAAERSTHSGIVFGHPRDHYIGEWVKFLESLQTAVTSDAMRNRIEFVRQKAGQRWPMIARLDSKSVSPLSHFSV